MENGSTVLNVVAAAIFDGDGRVLLQQMLPGKRHAGMWEFPGGKVKSYEKQELALVREIAEELAIELDPAWLEHIGTAQQAGEGAHPAIVMRLYRSNHWRGTVIPLDGQHWGWFGPSEVQALPMPPMDRILIERIRAA